MVRRATSTAHDLLDVQTPDEEVSGTPSASARAVMWGMLLTGMS